MSEKTSKFSQGRTTTTTKPATPATTKPSIPSTSSSKQAPAQSTITKGKENAKSLNNGFLLRTWGKYQKLPFKWKIYIGISTFVTVYIADSLGEKMMENSMVEYEANRRVEMEMEKLRNQQHIESQNR
ncbi:hypothetical protein BVG19_g333 [[Candida] boidinii]|nr:hypothetical protein BVG19_g333 [[Candida] boidinii]OWB49522.1 hypothetical protein B5S27_g1063 [[Candida] boidinii]